MRIEIIKPIDKGTRLSNYIVDFTAVNLVWLTIVYVFQITEYVYFLFYSIVFVYYLLFETLTNQTLGKMLTRSLVVNKDGKKANFLRILLRTFCRLIPFDAISYLFGSEQGMHDSLSGTKLVRK